jgi:hypothetical protein
VSVGFTTTKLTLDAQSGQLAQNLALFARSATNLEMYLTAVPDADLESLGYTADDVALLKSAAADMAKLAAIYRGEVEQTPAYDFRTFTLRIAGLQL